MKVGVTISRMGEHRTPIGEFRKLGYKLAYGLAYELDCKSGLWNSRNSNPNLNALQVEIVNKNKSRIGGLKQ